MNIDTELSLFFGGFFLGQGLMRLRDDTSQTEFIVGIVQAIAGLILLALAVLSIARKAGIPYGNA